METRRRQMAEFSSWIEWRRKYAQKGLVWPLLLSQSFLQSAPFIPIIMRAWPIVAEVTIENPLPLSRDRRHHFQTRYLSLFHQLYRWTRFLLKICPKLKINKLNCKTIKEGKLPGHSFYFWSPRNSSSELIFSQEKKSPSTGLTENIRYDYHHWNNWNEKSIISISFKAVTDWLYNFD